MVEGSHYFKKLSCLSLRKIYQNNGLLWLVYSSIRTESSILFLHRNKGFGEKPYFWHILRIFCVLFITHSNVRIKRLFSIVNRNQKDSSDRKKLNQKRALSDIVVVILYSPNTSEARCYDFQYEKILLEKIYCLL